MNTKTRGDSRSAATDCYLRHSDPPKTKELNGGMDYDQVCDLVLRSPQTGMALGIISAIDDVDGATEFRVGNSDEAWTVSIRMTEVSR
jgi:hypothetical protein